MKPQDPTAIATQPMQQPSMLFLLSLTLVAGLASAGETRVAIEENRWLINGKPTNPGSAAEGLLMNVRMVNATFEDRSGKEANFEAEANTDEFIASIPDYAAHGVNAFTLCLQGGMPGYEGALNSAFQADGSPRSEYLRRVERAIRACDKHGVVVILGCYYQRQSKTLRDEAALRAGLVHVANWIKESGFSNVVVEVANEYPHPGFVHDLIRNHQGQASLIRLVKRTQPDLLVTASGLGNGKIDPAVAEACDFLTPHWNGTKVEDIPDRASTLKRYGKPIVCNEDDKVGEQAVAALQATVAAGAAYGLMLKDHNQTFPFTFEGSADDPVFYESLKAITSTGGEESTEKQSTHGMTFPGAQWQEVPPRLESLDAVKLAAAVDYLEQNASRDGVRELVIVRRGKIVWKGADIDKVHGVWSCTKSFTSTVLGLLVEDGKCALDTPAAEFVPELKSHYGDLRLRHFTTMTSGYRAIGDEPQGGYKHGPSKTPFQPSDQPLFAPPGSQYAYWDSAMNMFGLVLTRAANEPMEVLFKRRIADAIGMNPKQWDWGDFATVDGVVVNGGSGNSGKHVVISAREMARLGHLFLNQGNWNGKQLIRREWIELATAVQVPAETPWAHPESNIDGRGVYGFNWWTNGVQPDGRRIWPDAPIDTFAASGHNNNKMFVVPRWSMVIVRLGLDERDGKITDAVWSRFLSLVGASRMD